MNIQKIELLKIKLSHKLPSKENYFLSKTFRFDNSNSHCLEQICFIALSFFGFELLRVNCSCSHSLQNFIFFLLLNCNTDYILLPIWLLNLGSDLSIDNIVWLDLAEAKITSQDAVKKMLELMEKWKYHGNFYFFNEIC